MGCSQIDVLFCFVHSFYFLLIANHAKRTLLKVLKRLTNIFMNMHKSSSEHEHMQNSMMISDLVGVFFVKTSENMQKLGSYY